MQTNVIQLVWHREHNVVMLDGQCTLYQVVNPECLPGSLTFRAMPVAAAIVTVTHRAAIFARLFVPAKDSSSATNDFAQHPVLQWGKLCFGNQTGAK
jgi:hypothetical protein